MDARQIPPPKLPELWVPTRGVPADGTDSLYCCSCSVCSGELVGSWEVLRPFRPNSHGGSTGVETDAAAGWLKWAGRLNGGEAELEMFWARLERKRGDLQAMDRHLATASDLGVRPERIRRERMLAAAQIGQLGPIEKRTEEMARRSG